MLEQESFTCTTDEVFLLSLSTCVFHEGGCGKRGERELILVSSRKRDGLDTRSG